MSARVNSLGDHIATLERDNAALRNEIERLEAHLNGAAPKLTDTPAPRHTHEELDVLRALADAVARRPQALPGLRADLEQRIAAARSREMECEELCCELLAEAERLHASCDVPASP